MLEFIRSQERTTIQEMVERFGVSAVTIRKDLEDLEREGLIVRTFGGAMALRTSDVVEAFQVRARLQSREKRLIGSAAARLIQPGESVIMDAGSTTLEIVRHLHGIESLNLITPALNVALEACTLPHVAVIVPGGGVLDHSTLSLEGPEIEEAFARLHADKFFMGVRSVDVQHGAMDTHMRRIRLKQAMMQAVRQTFIVADSSKFGKVSLFQIAPLSSVQAIVTDEGVSPDMLEQITALGVQVYIARAGEAPEVRQAATAQQGRQTDNSEELHL
jgi:DeoR family transcriptional regulator of aga operon